MTALLRWNSHTMVLPLKINSSIFFLTVFRVVQSILEHFYHCLPAIPCAQSRKWQPTPLFLSANPMARGAWRATVHGVPKSYPQKLWTPLTITPHFPPKPASPSTNLFSVFMGLLILDISKLFKGCTVFCYVDVPWLSSHLSAGGHLSYFHCR